MIMEKSKIRSPKTYSKAMGELGEWGYIKYLKSTSKNYGSKIILFTFDPKCNQDVPPINKQINHNIHKRKKNERLSQSQDFSQGKFPNNESKQMMPMAEGPPLLHVQIYFDEKRAPALEAEKFFNHYEAIGWVTSSHMPITNWKAIARNWILNISKFNLKGYTSNITVKKNSTKDKQTSGGQRPGSHHVNQNKDFDTPL